jgi:hypothetical protein
MVHHFRQLGGEGTHDPRPPFHFLSRPDSLRPPRDLPHHVGWQRGPRGRRFSLPRSKHTKAR